MSDNPKDDASNLVEGPRDDDGDPIDDPDLVGPDGTRYDKEAAEDAHRKMTGGGEENEANEDEDDEDG